MIQWLILSKNKTNTTITITNIIKVINLGKQVCITFICLARKSLRFANLIPSSPASWLIVSFPAVGRVTLRPKNLQFPLLSLRHRQSLLPSPSTSYSLAGFFSLLMSFPSTPLFHACRLPHYFLLLVFPLLSGQPFTWQSVQVVFNSTLEAKTWSSVLERTML